MRRMKKRQRLILQVLADLGGEATTKQIAELTDLHTNGVAQSLGALPEVACVGGRAGDTLWRIKDKNSRVAKRQLKRVDRKETEGATARHLFMREPGGEWIDKGINEELLALSGYPTPTEKEQDLIENLLDQYQIMVDDESQPPEYEFRDVEES